MSSPSVPPLTLVVAYKAVEGHEVHLECHLPGADQVRDASRPVPVVIWLHGGAFFDGARSDYSPVNLLSTLARGWAFVSLDYRLAPQVTLDDLLEDVRDGCEFVRAGRLDEALGGGKVDGERLAVTGSSAGGALAVFASYTLSRPPRACFSLYGSLDLLHPSYNAPLTFPSGHISLAEVSSHLDPNGPVVSHSAAEVDFSTMVAHNRTRACFFAIQEGKVLAWSTRTPPESIDLENPGDKLSGYRAVELVRRAKEPKRDNLPPTVCVHGTDDLMVPFELSRALVDELQRAGVDAELVEEAGANHGFDLIPGVWGDEVKMRVFERANDFLAKYLE
ncbi:Alpha/Beta hydrolase protein [Rhodotorula diobovata]|uniref:Alpha/Beta hydrolase protein n=1 Tax=Rhodotorula diobovata TaxID=5288 RepID=A0A5C5FZD5_9BASI|nr:Alpha/Beta hydrolase protein [Rhodotorula diobovata]